MSTPKNKPPGAKRGRKSNAQRSPAQVEARRGFADRFRALLNDRGVSPTQFAKRWGVTVTTVTRYLNVRGPEPERPAVEHIASETGVDLNWLLLADGDDDAPRYRTQNRTTAELATDVAAHVAREVSAAVRGDAVPGVTTAEHLAVDGGAILADAVGRNADALRAWLAPQLVALERRRVIDRAALDVHTAGTALAAHLAPESRAAVGRLLIGPVKELADVSGRLLPPVGDEPAVTLSQAGVAALYDALPRRPIPVGSLAPFGERGPTLGEARRIGPAALAEFSSSLRAMMRTSEQVRAGMIAGAAGESTTEPP